MLASIRKELSQSYLGNVLARLFCPEIRIFAITLFYYVSLYFSINNRTLLFLSFLYFGFIYVLIKDLKTSLFFVFFVTLPFAKGKSMEILLLPREQISRYAIFKISYFFHVYLSDVYLFLLYFLYIRQKIYDRITIVMPSFVKPILLTLLLFILVVIFQIWESLYPEVIMLSVVQLVRLVLLFFLPFVVSPKKESTYVRFFLIVAASIAFQAFWVFLQRLHGGPVGKDIEVIIPGTEFGIRSSEDRDILRATGTFFEPSILGTFLVMHVSMISHLLLRGIIHSHIIKRVLMTAVSMGAVAIIFTGSRGIYALAACIGLYLSIRNKLVLQRRFMWIFMGILALFLPFFIVRLQSLSDLFTPYGSGTYRLQMIQYALRLVIAKPLGVGINLSPYYFASAFPQEAFIFDPAYPHSLLFQLLAETGILGFSAFIFFIYLIFRPVLLRLRGSVFNAFGIGACMFLLASAMYPIFLNHQEIVSYLFLYLGMFTYTQYKRVSC